jgi:hypothetical protein
VADAGRRGLGVAGQFLAGVTDLGMTENHDQRDEKETTRHHRTGPDFGSVSDLELVGIVIAVIAALFVGVHAWIRDLSGWAILGWTLGTFLLFIVVLPLYLFLHWKEPTREEE